MKSRLLVGLTTVLCLSGCAAVAPAQLGQAMGTIIGAAAIPGIGAPLGALTGLLAGMLVQGQVDKTTETRERKELAQELGAPGQTPQAPDENVPPRGEPTRVWVDETKKDGRLVAGHFDVRYLP